MSEHLLVGLKWSFLSFIKIEFLASSLYFSLSLSLWEIFSLVSAWCTRLLLSFSADHSCQSFATVRPPITPGAESRRGAGGENHKVKRTRSNPSGRACPCYEISDALGEQVKTRASDAERRGRRSGWSWITAPHAPDAAVTLPCWSGFAYSPFPCDIWVEKLSGAKDRRVKGPRRSLQSIKKQFQFPFSGSQSQNRWH